MSEYGIKIKNIQAGSLYDYNLGVRANLDMKDAMLTNSLFSEFLLSIGLSVWKGESTRDVICLEFDYGSRSYADEVKHLNECIKRINKDQKIEDEARIKKLNAIEYLLGDVEKNKNNFKKMSAQDIRIEYYVNGVPITYHTHNKKGEIIKSETIHYKMLFRTPGKAKKGSCMFIRDELYEEARNFLYMGIKLPFENAPIVEIGAYSSLITSSIVGKVQIPPENILIVKDVDSFFDTNVISVETDENKRCRAVKRDNYRVKNTLFDGQALIDTSVFPDWGEGYILLRHHFTKMAAFHSNIQLFFKDYFGDKYETATVKDMFGNEILAKDVLMITTDNAIKWLKFDISFDYWADWVRANDSMWGIVKTAHQSKLGDVQRMSYQMINAIDMDVMPEVVQCSLDYIEKLKTDDETFLKYLVQNINFSNDYEVLYELVKQDPEFTRCDYFRDRKKRIIEAYTLNFKTGKIIQNADNLVIIGSPYAMLLHSVGEDVNNDDTFYREDNVIQCYTERFSSGEYLAEFRNPFNSKNNMGYLHNIYHSKLDKYFKFGPQIIAVNMIGTDFQDRNNGSDMDSDSIYTTNHPAIVECARKNYLEYPTIVNNIPKEKNSYQNTIENFAIIDNNLAAAQLAIGESSNLAQVCLTYTYNFNDQKYQDYVCILSVLAQVAIDNAKRRFDIDLTNEIKRIKQDMDIKTNGYPVFWTLIRSEFNGGRVNHKLMCPMNYLYALKPNKFRDSRSTLPISDFFVRYDVDLNRKLSKKVEELIEKYSLDLYNYNTSGNNDDYILLRSDFDDLIRDIRNTYLSKNYLSLMSWLINRAFRIGSGVRRNLVGMDSKIDSNKSLLLKVLYQVNPDNLLKCFAKNVKI